MNEGVTIKLNLKGLRNTESRKSSDTEIHQDTMKDENKYESFILKSLREISAPYRVEIREKGKTNSGDDLGSTQPDNAVKNIGEGTIKDNHTEKLSFATITGVTKQQEESLREERLVEQSNEQKDQEAKVQIEKEAIASTKEDNEKVKFKNYRSGFKDESENIIKKIQKLRYAPKTRVGFLTILIMFTGFSIGLLMIFFPEKHSPELYKASLLEIYRSDRKNQDYYNQEVNEIGIRNDTIEGYSGSTISKEEEMPQSVDIGSDSRENDAPPEQQINQQEKEMIRVRSHLLDRYK